MGEHCLRTLFRRVLSPCHIVLLLLNENNILPYARGCCCDEKTLTVALARGYANRNVRCEWIDLWLSHHCLARGSISSNRKEDRGLAPAKMHIKIKNWSIAGYTSIRHATCWAGSSNVQSIRPKDNTPVLLHRITYSLILNPTLKLILKLTSRP